MDERPIIAEGPTSGLILEDREGNIYLIRKEILAMAKVPAGLAEDARERIQAGATTIGPSDTLSSASATGFHVVGGVNIEHLEPVVALAT